MTEPYKTHGAIGSQNILPVINRFGQVEKAYKFWEKQIKHKPPPIVYDIIKQRSMADNHLLKNSLYGKWKILSIDNAKGEDVNLDFYSVEIESMPINPNTNKTYTEKELFDYIRKNAAYFFTTDEVELSPYDEKKDGEKWLSNNPIGTVMKFKVDIRDDLSVVCTEITSNNWIFTTIQTPEDFQHPVSGNREFGIKMYNGKLHFYTQGADRITGFIDLAENYYNPISMNDSIFMGADRLWKSVMKKVVQYIKANKGKAKFINANSKRYPWK